MENTDIIVLTAVVVVLFLVFIIATVREFIQIDETVNYSTTVEKGPRADLMRFIGSVFNDERIDVKKKMRIMDAVKNVMEDTETDDEPKDLNK